MEKLKLVEKRKFGSITCDVYEKGNEYFVTREQIGKALGYKDPKRSIELIHNSHKDRLDKFSTTEFASRVEGKRKVTRNRILYSAKGVYEICRWSNQPKANDFYDFLYELLENIRTEKIKLKFEQKTPEWQQLRLTAKTSTKTLHDTIDKVFLPYAISSGSETYKNNPELAYTHFEKPINKALGIDKHTRAYLDKKSQTLLDLMNNTIMCLIEELVYNGIDYHDIVSTSKDKINQLYEIFHTI